MIREENEGIVIASIGIEKDGVTTTEAVFVRADEVKLDKYIYMDVIIAGQKTE